MPVGRDKAVSVRPCAPSPLSTAHQRIADHAAPIMVTLLGSSTSGKAGYRVRVGSAAMAGRCPGAKAYFLDALALGLWDEVVMRAETPGAGLCGRNRCAEACGAKRGRRAPLGWRPRPTQGGLETSAEGLRSVHPSRLVGPPRGSVPNRSAGSVAPPRAERAHICEHWYQRSPGGVWSWPRSAGRSVPMSRRRPRRSGQPPDRSERRRRCRAMAKKCW